MSIARAVISVIIASHEPNRVHLESALFALRAQSLPRDRWELLIIDNASSRFPPAEFFATIVGTSLRVIREPQLGLSTARRRGFAAATGEFAVLVDDDNVLAPDYLAQVVALFAAHPRIGALGGKSVPEFALEPPAWTREFHPLLALRDLGDTPLISRGLRPPGAAHNEYPLFAPLGAGMALRRAAWQAWCDLRRENGTSLPDRRGAELTSSGDNDIVLAAMKAGWEVGYFPQLRLTHLIPAPRLEPDYLARLNRGIQTSWMQVLAMHDACPWPPLTRIGAGLRKAKAWLLAPPWRSTAARIRYAGVCGHFDGRIRT